MAYATTLDVRTLADEWADLLFEREAELEAAAEHIDPVGESQSVREGFAQETARFEDLCDELGVGRIPDELRLYGDDCDPLILASTFEDYARELAEELGELPDANHWPLYCIDWAYAARELSYDYTMVTYDGDDYYIRSV